MIPKRSMPSWFYWIPFVFALILYGNTIPNEFTLDDLPQIVNNKFVQEGFEGIPKLIATNYWSGSGQNLGYYRPLSHITFALEKELYN
nr:tetratricopeptide repeat protein [Bacteroidota bacterium]